MTECIWGTVLNLVTDFQNSCNCVTGLLKVFKGQVALILT